MAGKEVPVKLKPIYYFFGEEDYLIEASLEKIKKTTLTKGFESMNCHHYEAGALNPSDVMQAALTLPVFSSTRLVIVGGAEELTEKKKGEFIEYFNAPSPSTCLVFISGEGKIKKDSEFFKSLSKAGEVKEHKRLKTEELRAWIKDYAKNGGKVITAAAAERLLELVGEGMRNLKSELDKLIVFKGHDAPHKGSGATIEEEDVNTCTLGVNEDNAFDLADAIVRKDAPTAFKILKGLDDEPPKILGAIAWQIRVLIKVKSCLKKGITGYRLQQFLRISEKNAGRYVKAVEKLSEGELLYALTRLSKADIDLKSGRLPAGLVMSRLTTELVSGNKMPLARASNRQA